jgi:riboflavin synthase
MFTGIIETVEKIKSLNKRGKDFELEVAYNHLVLDDISLGDSISINGICLTVKKFDSKYLQFDISNETIKRTAILKKNQFVNLERSLKFNGKISGHFVSGHIDGVGRILSINKKDSCIEWGIEAPKNLLKFIAEKGSITINGVSLTINTIIKNKFSINLIPFTLKETCFHKFEEGDMVNIEIDMLARYTETLLKNNR